MLTGRELGGADPVAGGKAWLQEFRPLGPLVGAEVLPQLEGEWGPPFTSADLYCLYSKIREVQTGPELVDPFTTPQLLHKESNCLQASCAECDSPSDRRWTHLLLPFLRAQTGPRFALKGARASPQTQVNSSSKTSVATGSGHLPPSQRLCIQVDAFQHTVGGCSAFRRKEIFGNLLAG